VEVERIYPDRGRVAVEELVSGLGFGDRAPTDRPYVTLNMVASADGKATLGGRTKGLTSPPDRAIFHHLRTQVDAVMFGARTLRAEPYARLVRDSALRAKRLREGLAADPLACVVSGRLDLPADLPLWQDRDSRVLVLTASRETLPTVPATVEYLRAPSAPIRLGPLLGEARNGLGVRSVLCEGGPTLNATLLHECLVDELFLSVAPMLTAEAAAPTIVEGPALELPLELELRWVLESEGHLFMRYRVTA
jgi:riboflavin-specific deaminase-like protein